ncbi:MAG: long-chain fatty acid--CoA ligase [Kiloniellaceae bacterium]
MARLWAGLRTRVALLLAVFRGRLEPAAPEVAPGPVPHPWEASYPDGLDWHLEIARKPLCAVLDEAVTRWPDKPCLAFLGKRYSYAEVGELVARAAKGLQEIGVEKGVRVGLFLPNSPYYVICYHAVLKAGGTVVNYNPLYAEREIARQIRDSGTRIMVTLNLNTLYPKIARRLADTCLEKVVVCAMSGALKFPKKTLFLLFKRKEVAQIPDDKAHVRFEKLISNDGLPRLVEIEPDRDIAVLQYTGGTTGLPKGAMLSHGALYANTLQTRLWATDLSAGAERVLAVLPLFHVFGMTAVMNVGLSAGAEILLLPRFKVAEVLSVIDKEKPTVFMAVPTIYSAINEHKERDRYDLSSLRFCISGGAPLALAIKTKFESLTGCSLVEGYGLTEAGPVCTINPIGGLNKPNSAGLPLPGTMIEVVALDDPERVLPPGAQGEICVKGPQVMAGYWNREAETRDVLKEGRLRTGDIGYMDEDGYVYLIDRIKDLVISGGFNVYPRMVEEAIYLHPAVAEVAVCGVPDPHRGEVVKAFVKLRGRDVRLTGAELRAFLKDKLAPFEIPRKVEFRDEIPKTLVGKPLRRVLIDEERRRLDRRAAKPPVEPARAEPAEAHRGGRPA